MKSFAVIPIMLHYIKVNSIIIIKKSHYVLCLIPHNTACQKNRKSKNPIASVVDKITYFYFTYIKSYGIIMPINKLGCVCTFINHAVQC